MNDPGCGCCAGTRALTPVPTGNRPGLDALSYRVGTHGSFLRTMLARLSSHRLPDHRRPLQGLTTRAPSDPAIALLDAWATVADILTFYQERIANEGYLATATERRSVLELARLVGYELRPGVAASVYLAFTLEEDFAVDIPAGTRAQSVPEPDDLPQTFETEEVLAGRAEWNAIAARRSRPSLILPIPPSPAEEFRSFRVPGAVPELKANGALLLVCPFTSRPQPYTIRSVEADPAADTTRVTYVPFDAVPTPPPPPPPIEVTIASLFTRSSEGNQVTPVPSPLRGPALTRLGSIVQALGKEPSLPPPSRFQLAREPERTYGAAADLGPQLLAAFRPRLRPSLYAAYANAPVTDIGSEGLCGVEALEVKAAVFGHNAPKRRELSHGMLQSPEEWDLLELGPPSDAPVDERLLRTISLDAEYDRITPGTWILIDRPEPSGSLQVPIITRVEEVRTSSRADYGISAKVTQLVLADPWLSDADRNADLGLLRQTAVHAQSARLELAEEPIEEDVEGETIELDGLYDGLEAGRWLVVRGLRTDVPGLEEGDEEDGVEASELAMLAGVLHDVHKLALEDGGEVELPTDTLHTRLVLAEPLAYRYRRESVRVNANVARATHGETRREVLGSGDGSRKLQEFTLKQKPLTHVAAPTPKGVESTLEVRVGEVRWPEKPTLLSLGEGERGYVTRTDDDGHTAVVFGDGTRGARLPTGVENVTAVYRSGIGRGGNVPADRISTLASQPLGVKQVLNPQRASGGADPETRDQARKNAPLAVLALDRLVSVQDYADFARTFAGIGKASAIALSDGRREVVHLTIAGADDVPIDASSDLHRNLLRALRRFGDPNTPLQVDLREAMFLFLAGRVKVREEALWDHVERRLRSSLLESFGFEAHELGQSVLLSEVVGVMQGVDGVDYVDVDLFDGISETEALDPEELADRLASLAGTPGGEAPSRGPCRQQPRPRVRVHPARVDPSAPEPAARIRPAQLAFLNPELPDTLILTEIPS